MTNASSEQPEAPPVHRTEVDGVPTFWSPSPGPMTAALMFRVGTGDEGLAQYGISHLVEHLVMHELRERRYQMNAFVDLRRTVFHCRGNVEELREFLTVICAALRSLPLDRVVRERAVLESESTSRPTSVADSLATVRYGAKGIGKSTYREFGLLWLGPNELLEWTKLNFTRGNAALWMSGPVPEGLALDLNDGPRRYEMKTDAVPTRLPAWYPGMNGVIGMSMVGERSVEVMTGAVVFDRRIKDRIRHDLGLSYSPGCSYLPLSTTEAHLVAASEGVPENFKGIRDGIVDVLEELSAAGPEKREIDDYIRDVIRSTEEPTAALGLLDFAATCELTGDEWLSTEELLGRLRELTTEEVGRALSQVKGTALLSIPDDVDPPEGFDGIPNYSDMRIDGPIFKPRSLPNEPGSPNRSLIAGPAGASLVFEEGAITVRSDRCQALLSYSDGGRTLIGNDGFHLSIRPEEWKKGADAIAALESSVPVHLHVQMPKDAKTPSAAVASKKKKKPLLRPGLRKLAWATWFLISMLTALDLLWAPTVHESEIPPSIQVPIAADGTADCGQNSAYRLLLEGANPQVEGEGREVLVQLCEGEATSMLLFGLLGTVSFFAAAFLGVRALWKKHRATR